MCCSKRGGEGVVERLRDLASARGIAEVGPGTGSRQQVVLRPPKSDHETTDGVGRRVALLLPSVTGR